MRHVTVGLIRAQHPVFRMWQEALASGTLILGTRLLLHHTQEHKGKDCGLNAV